MATRIGYVPVSELSLKGDTVIKPGELVVTMDGKDIGLLSYEPYGMMYFFAPRAHTGEPFRDLVTMQVTLEERYPAPDADAEDEDEDEDGEDTSDQEPYPGELAEDERYPGRGGY